MKKILIIDDSQMSRNYHSAILQENGYEILQAADGAEGLEKALMNQIDAVMVDINMPVMDGFEFIRRLRCEESHKLLPVIIMSTEKSDEDVTQGMNAGANLYLVKPVDPDTLLDSIEKMIPKFKKLEAK
ncbi:MAG: response regulator [Candidatus Riflebacteria bacterium]|nr:response regulator [Candidatus Riflebacteria bacterium]